MIEGDSGGRREKEAESGSCVQQSAKCGQPVMIVRMAMVDAIFHRELSTYYVSRTQRSHRVSRPPLPPPFSLLLPPQPSSLAASFTFPLSRPILPLSTSSSFVLFFIVVLEYRLSFSHSRSPGSPPLSRSRSVRRSKSQRILIKRVTHFEPDIHVTMANGSLVISRTHIASLVIIGPDTTMNFPLF